MEPNWVFNGMGRSCIDRFTTEFTTNCQKFTAQDPVMEKLVPNDYDIDASFGGYSEFNEHYHDGDFGTIMGSSFNNPITIESVADAGLNFTAQGSFMVDSLVPSCETNEASLGGYSSGLKEYSDEYLGSLLLGSLCKPITVDDYVVADVEIAKNSTFDDGLIQYNMDDERFIQFSGMKESSNEDLYDEMCQFLPKTDTLALNFDSANEAVYQGNRVGFGIQPMLQQDIYGVNQQETQVDILQKLQARVADQSQPKQKLDFLQTLRAKDCNYQPKKRNFCSSKRKCDAIVSAKELKMDNLGWKRYGKDSTQTKFYYQCRRSNGCPAKRHVQKIWDNPEKFAVWFSNDHHQNCENISAAKCKNDGENGYQLFKEEPEDWYEGYYYERCKLIA